ncbi:hypothetical protein GCM10007276_10660 [Agaricicola taiwanensis]|uniref:Glycosyltransferase n=1 Tax=Agaricicola taiwanensis TaxID=591372 RepID=A0A8J2YFV4_9RHOB|nr:glycosyltransferase [Agaricicola taiwanensis]GGE35009.1 hypothetical protein GCM10007276_10660 [Agaricicola taiwanensis]
MPAKVIFVLPDLAGGGAQRVMLTLSSALDPTRYTPSLLVVGGQGPLSPAVPRDLPVTYGHHSRIRSALPWMLGQIRASRPAAIVSTLAYVNLALLAAKPLLPRNTRLIVREANRPEATIAAMPRLLPAKQLYRWLYPRADAVIAQTAEIAAALERLVPRIGARLSLLPNPVAVEELRRRAMHPERQAGSGLQLVAAGRLTRQKGFDRLIHLMMQLPADTRLDILGDGPLRSELSEMIQAAQLQERVTLPGFTSTVAAHLAGADALVMTSLWEGLPNVALEALAVGTPVIGTPQSGLAELAAEIPDAVQVADHDDDFTAYLGRLQPTRAPVEKPRPSLLPERYTASMVAAGFETLLSDALNRRP